MTDDGEILNLRVKSNSPERRSMCVSIYSCSFWVHIRYISLCTCDNIYFITDARRAPCEGQMQSRRMNSDLSTYLATEWYRILFSSSPQWLASLDNMRTVWLMRTHFRIRPSPSCVVIDFVILVGRQCMVSYKFSTDTSAVSPMPSPPCACYTRIWSSCSSSSSISFISSRNLVLFCKRCVTHRDMLVLTCDGRHTCYLLPAVRTYDSSRMNLSLHSSSFQMFPRYRYRRGTSGVLFSKQQSLHWRSAIDMRELFWFSPPLDVRF